MRTLLQINSVAGCGSTGGIVSGLARLAAGAGWNSLIAYGRGTGSDELQAVRVGTDCDVRRHGVVTRLFDRHGLGSRTATERFITRMEQVRPDLIHLHNLHGYYLNIRVLFEWLSTRDIPVVWTFHDCWPMTGHCSHFDHIGCEKWKTVCRQCPQTGRYPASILLDRSEKNFRLKRVLFTSVKRMTIVPVSRWLNGVVGQSFLGDVPRKVIYNGVDTGLYKPAESSDVRRKFGVDGKFIILGAAGKWDDRKGLFDFIELAGRTGPDVAIILAGLNRRQLKNLPANVTGTGRLGSLEELAGLYSAADVYLNLSAEETFGLTTAEALACGTPVVVYNATASPELVSPETGIVVEKGDISGLLNAVGIIRNNGKTAYSAACRQRALDFFNRDRMLSEYLELYESVHTKQSKDV